MRNDAKAESKTNRRPLYIIGGVLLTVILVSFGFSDSLGSLFERTPSESSLAGSWVFDSARAKELMDPSVGSNQQMLLMEKRYGKTVYTFAPGTITIDTGIGLAEATPCTIKGYPPNAFLVTIGEGKTKREVVFQLDASTGVKQLYLSTEGDMVPFKIKD